jgi:hypothetical protein
MERLNQGYARMASPKRKVAPIKSRTRNLIGITS